MNRLRGRIHHQSDIVGHEYDSHTQYTLVDGSRGFTATISGITPVLDNDLCTKDYADTLISGVLVSGVVTHDLLLGLDADDHIQYLLEDGTRAMSGNLDMGSQAITSVGNVDGRDVSADGSTLDSHTADSTIHFVEGSIDHTAISNIGVQTHTQLDEHVDSGVAHFADESNPHSVTLGQVGGTTDHTALSNIGTNTHPQIDALVDSGVSHFNDTSDPHQTTWAQVDKSTSDIADITTKSHTSLSDIGIQTHAQLDEHVDSGVAHFANESNPHSVTLGQVGGTTDHTALSNIGTQTHAQIDVLVDSGIAHFADTNDPHDITWAQIDKSTSDIADITTKSHTSLSDIGTQTHPQLDVLVDSGVAHFTDTTIHFVEGSIDHTAITNIGIQTHTQLDALVDSGVAHFTDTNDPHGITWAQVDKSTSDIADITTKSHTSLSDIGVQTHAQLDEHVDSGVAHFNDTNDPHDITWAQVDKSTSDIADITTKSHTSLSDIGTQTHAQLDEHVDSGVAHFADTTIHFTEASIDHGSIAGLGDDDHTQYHNNTRGDARYYTQTQLGSSTVGTSGASLIKLNALSGTAASVQLSIDGTNSSLYYSGGVITESVNVRGTIDISTIYGSTKTSADNEATEMASFTITGVANQAVSAGHNFICIDYNSGTPVFSVETSEPNHGTVWSIGRVFKDDIGHLHTIQGGHAFLGFPLKAHRRFLKVDGLTRATGLVTTEGAEDRTLEITAGVLFYGINEFSHPSFDGDMVADITGGGSGGTIPTVSGIVLDSGEGDKTSSFDYGDHLVIDDSSNGNDGAYHVFSSSWDGSNTSILVEESTLTTGADTGHVHCCPFVYWSYSTNGGWEAKDFAGEDSAALIDNFYYNDITQADGSQFVELIPNRYTVAWVYASTDDHINVVYGQGSYTLGEAIDVGPPASLPDLINSLGFLIAKIILKKSAANFSSITYPWTTTFSATGAADHGGLAGLGDDDHTQYVLVDGTRAMSGNLDMGSNAIVSVGNVDGRDVSADGAILDAIVDSGVAHFADTAVHWTNDGTTSDFLGTAGDYARIGDAAGTSHSLDSEDDLMVTGELEVDGVTFLDAATTIDGSADAIQLTVQGNGTQTSDIFVVEKSDGEDYFAIDGNGDMVTDSTTDTNTWVGVGAGNDGIGTENLGAGNNALGAIEAGAINNVGIGSNAAAALTTSSGTVAIGVDAGKSLTTIGDNVAIGTSALATAVVAQKCTAIGTRSMEASTGWSNIGIGYETLRTNTTGSSCLAIGSRALASTTTENALMAIGAGALENNTTGDNNQAIGTLAMQDNTSGRRNIAIGINAMQLNNGNYNLALGWRAAYSNVSGAYNIAIGYAALILSTVSYNTAIGCYALTDNEEGQVNTAIGYKALFKNTDGGANMALGPNSLQDNTTGNYNTAIGYQAMTDNTTGDNNTAIGPAALRNVTGNGNTGIGFNAGKGQVGISNQLWIANTDTSTPLIYGEFDNNILKFNADVTIGVGTAGKDYTLTFDGDDSDGVLTWLEDEDTFRLEDDLIFAAGAGLAYGTCYGDHIAFDQDDLAQNTWYNINDADMASGPLNNVAHDGNGLLTVTYAGDYQVSFNVAYELDTAAVHLEFGIEIDGGAPAAGSPLAHTTSFFANQEQDSSASAIIALTAGQTIQVAARTIDGGTPDIVVDNVYLNCLMVGG